MLSQGPEYRARQWKLIYMGEYYHDTEFSILAIPQRVGADMLVKQ